jgi:hypothetical protein
MVNNYRLQKYKPLIVRNFSENPRLKFSCFAIREFSRLMLSNLVAFFLMQVITAAFTWNLT